jgi:hypothetical protein
MTKPISIKSEDLENALAILDRWGSGDSGLPSASEFQLQGTSTGVTSEFHSHLTASAQVFSKLAADIRSAMATAHKNVTETVVELSNTDASSAQVANGLASAVAPIATTIEGSPSSRTDSPPPPPTDRPVPPAAAASGDVTASTDF